MTRMKIAVMGAGAIGSLFGGLLAQAGNDVTLIGRISHVEAIRASGLRIKGLLNRRVENLKARLGFEDYEDFDLVLMTVKAYDVKNASYEIEPFVDEDMPIMCLQNGIGVDEEASEVLGKERLLRGVTYCGASLDAPGTVTCTGLGETVIGRFSGDSVGLNDIAEMFEASGLPVRISRDIQRTVWIKTLVNSGINPYGALTGMRNGELLKSEELRWLMSETVMEGVKVAEKLGVQIEEDAAKLTFRTAEATAGNLNSMLQDVRKGKRTEIDYVNGAISRLGRKVSVSTPLNSLLTFLVKNLESKSRRETVYAVSPI